MDANIRKTAILTNRLAAQPMLLIRDATSDDQPAISAVMAAATAQLRRVYKPTEAAMARARAAPVQRLVAVLDGRIVGALRYTKEDGRLHLGLGVHPDHHRQGIARAMIEALAARARQLGLSSLSLYTIKETGNVPIFQRLGFTPIREEPPKDLECVTGLPLSEVYMERVLDLSVQ